MPLPLLFIAVSVMAGSLGIKKGVEAHADSSEAERLKREAHERYGSAEHGLLGSRSQAAGALDSLGRLKLEVWETELARFAELYGRLHPIELINRMDVESGRVPVTQAELAKLQELSGLAQQALAGGGLALGAGALAGVAAYGGAIMFAAASSGTAISTLAGAAATNATLAWFGGGSLAAGGMGMAGGMAVLGGIVAGPVLAVGGVVWAAMARENLAKARGNLAEAQRAAAQMQAAAAILDGITAVAAQFSHAILAVRERFRLLLAAFAEQSEQLGNDYRQYTREQRELVHLVVQAAQVMKALLETPFLTQEGALRQDYGASLASAAKLLPKGE